MSFIFFLQNRYIFYFMYIYMYPARNIHAILSKFKTITFRLGKTVSHIYSNNIIGVYCDDKLNHRGSCVLPDSTRRRISTTSWHLDCPTWDDRWRSGPTRTARSTTRTRNRTWWTSGTPWTDAGAPLPYTTNSATRKSQGAASPTTTTLPSSCTVLT